jgi:arsenical pump membrane protein
VAAVASAAADPAGAAGAASQTWPAFVLVAGLLLIGLVAAEDGLFEGAGQRLASATDSALVLFAGFSTLVVLVTAVLNLDTSVAFLTPVAVHTSRRRGDDRAVLVSACLLLSNAGSLLLPGSNLTNLIVLGKLHLSGARFAARMGTPWLGAALITAAVVWVSGRRRLGHLSRGTVREERLVPGLGALAVAAAVGVIIAVSSPAPAVAGIGAAAVLIRLGQRRLQGRRVWNVVDLPVLLGLFGLAVGLGALGRAWSGAAQALGHLDSWETAGAGAASSVAINNLPAASLLSARVPAHPLSLLIGLNVGPNLFFTGSLAWVLWYKAAKASGGEPDVRRTVRLGLISAPLALAAAVGLLLLAGSAT